MKILRLIKEYQKNNPHYDFGDLHPFVFAPQTEEGKDPEFLEETDEEIILACPFEEWSLEYDGKHYITAPHASDPVRIYFEAIYVKELDPTNFEFIVGMEIESGSQRIYRTQKFTKENPDEDAYRSVLNLVNVSIKRMRGHRKGKIKRSGKVAMRSKGRTILYKPSKVIYVGSKKKDKREKSISGQPIHWLESWDVMGHFRQLENPSSIGKDRLGNRTIKGLTWVVDHVRGEGAKKTKVRRVR